MLDRLTTIDVDILWEEYRHVSWYHNTTNIKALFIINLLVLTSSFELENNHDFNFFVCLFVCVLFQRNILHLKF